MSTILKEKNHVETYLEKKVVVIAGGGKNPGGLIARDFAARGVSGIAINTVGMVLKKPIVETTEDEYDRMFAANTKSAFFFLQEAAKNLNDNGKICTIVTSLLGAFTGLYSPYAGSKAAVDQFTRGAAKELGSRGISVTAVAPGRTDRHQRYCSTRSFSCDRRLVDHRSDDLCQWRLYHAIVFLNGSSGKPGGLW